MAKISNSNIFKLILLSCGVFALGFFAAFHLLQAAPSAQELTYADMHCLDWARSRVEFLETEKKVFNLGVFDLERVKCSEENGFSILHAYGKHSDYKELNLTDMQRVVLNTIPVTNEQQFEYEKKTNTKTGETHESLIVGNMKVIG